MSCMAQWRLGGEDNTWKGYIKPLVTKILGIRFYSRFSNSFTINTFKRFRGHSFIKLSVEDSFQPQPSIPVITQYSLLSKI